jgi:DNA-binding transcriptional MocR family regulator
LVSSSTWASYVRTLRGALRERRDSALAALSRHFPEAKLARVPSAGFALWLELPAEADEASFVSAALADGVQINAGAPWFAAESPAPHVRISIAGAPSDQLEQGIARLGRLWRAR